MSTKISRGMQEQLKNVGIGILVLGIALFAVVTNPQNAARLFHLQHFGAGKLAPEIVGVDVAGKAMKLSDFRGKVVMLDFFGNW